MVFPSQFMKTLFSQLVFQDANFGVILDSSLPPHLTTNPSTNPVGFTLKISGIRPLLNASGLPCHHFSSQLLKMLFNHLPASALTASQSIFSIVTTVIFLKDKSNCFTPQLKTLWLPLYLPVKVHSVTPKVSVWWGPITSLPLDLPFSLSFAYFTPISYHLDP